MQSILPSFLASTPSLALSYHEEKYIASRIMEIPGLTSPEIYCMPGRPCSNCQDQLYGNSGRAEALPLNLCLLSGSPPPHLPGGHETCEHDTQEVKYRGTCTTSGWKNCAGIIPFIRSLSRPCFLRTCVAA